MTTWLREQTEETSDMKVLEDMEISDLNMETVHAYRNRHTAYRPEHVWNGNLFNFFFRVYSKLVKDLEIPFKLEGITRIDDTPVHKALREALANCLVNTDFFMPRGVIIRKDADKIIMENPGYIRTGKDQMLKGDISDPRNKALMKMFNMIGIGEHIRLSSVRTRVILSELIEEGKIRTEGNGRSRRYTLASPFHIE